MKSLKNDFFRQEAEAAAAAAGCECAEDNEETMSLCDRRNQQPNGKIEMAWIECIYTLDLLLFRVLSF